ERHAQHLEILMPLAPLTVEGGAVRLQQVFTNLLNNASKYTPEGGRVWLKATIEDEEAVVRIEDDGVGIPPEMLGFIFEMFVQVRSPAANGDGLGIGLSLVKEL